MEHEAPCRYFGSWWARKCSCRGRVASTRGRLTCERGLDEGLSKPQSKSSWKIILWIRVLLGGAAWSCLMFFRGWGFRTHGPRPHEAEAGERLPNVTWADDLFLIGKNGAEAQAMTKAAANASRGKELEMSAHEVKVGSAFDLAAIQVWGQAVRNYPHWGPGPGDSYHRGVESVLSHAETKSLRSPWRCRFGGCAGTRRWRSERGAGVGRARSGGQKAIRMLT